MLISSRADPLNHVFMFLHKHCHSSHVLVSTHSSQLKGLNACKVLHVQRSRPQVLVAVTFANGKQPGHQCYVRVLHQKGMTKEEVVVDHFQTLSAFECL